MRSVQASVIKALIYDLDGVLLDTKDWHYKALNDALRNYGLQMSRTENDETYEGLPTTEKLKLLTKNHGLDESLYTDIIRMKNARLRVYFEKNYSVDPVKIKLLKNLHLNGFKQILCSNTTEKTVHLMINKTKIQDYFDAVITRQDIIKAKPNPEIFNKAISMVNLSPKECLILEDSRHGIQAALLSGANVMKISSVQNVNLENMSKELARYKN